jgi:hypothetical protein
VNGGRYQRKLKSNLLLVQSVTTAVLFATGDAIAQQAVERKGLKSHDLERTGCMALYGGGKTRCFLPSLATDPQEQILISKM